MDVGLQSGMNLDDGPPDPGNGIAGVLQNGLAGPTMQGLPVQAGAAANAVQPPAPPQPQPTDAPKKHGGLLTGLVGVLLDGLSAGVRTPQGPQGFSQSAATAAQMPMQRKQQQIGLQTQQMQLKAQMAQAHIQQLQSRLMASSLDDEVASGLTDAAWKFATNSVEQGTAKMVSGAGSREAAFSKLKELHDSSSPDSQGNLFAYPAGKDKDGNSTWAVYETYPNKTLQEETKFHLDGDKDNGVDDVDQTFPAGTPMSVYTSTVSQLSRDHIAKLHAATQKDKPDQTQVVQNMIGGKPHNVLVNKQSGATIKDLGEAQPKASPGDTSKPDRSAAEAEIKDHYKTYSSAERQAKDILSALDQAGNGNQVAAALAPLENTLFITSQAGIKRVNHTELDMNMPNAGSIVRNADAWMSKKVEGALPAGYVKDLKALVDLYRKSNEADYKANVDSANVRHNTKIPYGLPDNGREQKAAERAQAPPAGATMKVPDKQGNLHWSDGKKDLGLVNP